MPESTTYSVPAIHCEHCALSIREEVSEVPGVDTIYVDLDAKTVTVAGREVSDDLVRAAIVEAGYEPA
ncbi:MAG: heavy-metal-associated domain-containing protein [Actinobacteria bacterium]|nr:heavy-metal-associated domain-containing protein [Actinomycetota bacterium]